MEHEPHLLMTARPAVIFWRSLVTRQVRSKEVEVLLG